MRSPLDLRDLEIDESDPNAGISDLEWRQAAFIQKLVIVASYADDRRRFIAVALRAYRYRLHIDVHRPDLRETAAESMIKALPPEWHEAWLWGYRWQPESPYAPTGSRAILDAVSPTVRKGMLESLAEIGVTPPAASEASKIQYDVVLTDFSTPERAESIDRQGEWYYVEGVRYCLRCQTRRCERQQGSMPCNANRGFPEPS